MLSVSLALATTGCLKNIDQDAKSGNDRRAKGAKQIELEEGEGKARGIVTYPGGDRVDWKYFEIPEGGKAKAEIRLRHRPPRPGLDVAMNVFDQWGERIERAKPSIKRAKRTKRVRLDGLEPGKYYVQIYAPRRTDAGEYRLRVRTKQMAEDVKQVDLEALADQIPDPPVLPAPIEPVELSAEEKAAQEEAERKAAEEAEKLAAEEAERLANAPKPTTAKVVGFQLASGGSVIITLNRGKNVGVERGWSGQVLQGGRDGSPLAGGEFKVMRVTNSKSVGKVKLSLDVIRANRYVLLSPPGGAPAP